MFAFDAIEKNVRVIGEFILEREDPHGFWVIKKARGKVPEQLRQRFTDTYHAGNAIKAWQANQLKKA